MTPEDFSERLLAWFREHGRHDLPWQQDRDPYRIWIAEIMLQQTQVSTVIPYYECFMARFPDVAALAAADLDSVLHLWTGLGYYARARNLHRAARIIDAYGGVFPAELDGVMALPGIGRSTAGAILAQAHGMRQPILDGNVKRVLCRVEAIDGWPGQADVDRRLWALSEHYTPHAAVADYTQAIMDLGATVCRRSNPACDRCPLRHGCQAQRQGITAQLPTPRPRKTLPVRDTAMLLLCCGQREVLLERRPPSGIWGGLWSFPETQLDTADSEALQAHCQERYHCRVDAIEIWPVRKHTFSHFHLNITPLLMHVTGVRAAVMENANTLWYNTCQPEDLGFAAPVRTLLDQLTTVTPGEQP